MTPHSGRTGKLWEELKEVRRIAESAKGTAESTSEEVDARGLPSQELAARVTAGLRVAEKRLDKYEFAVEVLRAELKEARRAIERNETFIRGDPSQDRPGAAEDLRYLKRWVGRIESKLNQLDEMTSQAPVTVEATIPEQTIEIEATQWKREELSAWSEFARKYLGWFLAIALTALAVYWGVTEVLPGLLAGGG